MRKASTRTKRRKANDDLWEAFMQPEESRSKLSDMQWAETETGGEKKE
jgi:hypothetical protein